MTALLNRLRGLFRTRQDHERAFNEWGARAAERQNASRAIVAWTDSPLVSREYIEPAVSGEAGRPWLEAVRLRYFPAPAALALSIGAGDGGLERHGIVAGLAERFEAFDASAGAVELAGRLAREHHVDDRVTYSVADLNDHRFETARYDAAFASMAVHHIDRLDYFLGQVSNALKPDALFVMNEFVGPDQFQWTDRQLRLADDLLLTIPERYRRSLLSGHVKVRNVRQTVDHMNAVDPTEAIHSSKIIPLLRKRFDLVEQIDYGGTLLNLVLEEIAGNFEDTAEDLAVLRPLFDAERDYLRRGVISSDFTVLVARNRART